MLTVEEIKQFIFDDIASEQKRFARVGLRYYEGEHDIKDYKLYYYNADGELTEDKARSNMKIVHPFFTELVDQLVAYILSNPENIIKSDDEELQTELNIYFDEEFWSEAADLLTGAYAGGFEYMYGYRHAEDRTAFACADAIGVIEVRAKDTDSGAEHIIYRYIDRVDKGRKVIWRIQVHDAEQIAYYVQVDDGEIIEDTDRENNPAPHYIVRDKKGKLFGESYGFIPFWRLDNNKARQSGLKPIKSLIDDYDLMQCGLSNNLQDFDTPIHVVKGYEGDNLDELQQNIKTKKVVSTSGDGGIDILTVNVPYQARKTKADEDEKNIYRFGMGLNTQGLKDTSATTNIAIKMAYTLLDLKADKLERRFKKFLRDLIQVALDEINEKLGRDYRQKDVYFDFTHDIIVNEKENAEIEQIEANAEQVKINTVLNLVATIGDEKALQAICEIMEWDYDELKDKVIDASPEEDLFGAMNTLSGVKTEEVVTDESAAETGTGAIPEQ